jgi:hypothetical protein
MRRTLRFPAIHNKAGISRPPGAETDNREVASFETNQLNEGKEESGI